MENSPEPASSDAPETPQRMSSPPTFDNPRALKRASMPARPPTAVARHSKRLTLNFPINLPTAPISRSEMASPMTPASQSSAHPSPITRATTPALLDELNDGYDFLTAIAAQERKVLELREELQRAESELATLKKQWALAEKTRKRTDININVEALRALRSPELQSGDGSAERSGVTSPSIAQKRISRELDRQNLLRNFPGDGGTSISANGRRVFHGSRHTRTLSLLSQDLNKQSRDGENNNARPEGQRIGRTPRSATLPSIERSCDATAAKASAVSSSIAQWRRSMPPTSSGEALLRTGRQMASDLKEGFWTFLEDIRQATVGEEGISATESRTVPPASTAQRPARRTDRSVTPKASERPADAGSNARSTSSSAASTRERGAGAGAAKSGKDTTSTDISTSFWSEFGVDVPGQKSASNTTTTNKNNNNKNKHAESIPSEKKEQAESNLIDIDDNWDMWDTPQPSNNRTHTPSASSSTIGSKRDQSPATQSSSPRTSTRSVVLVNYLLSSYLCDSF